MSIKSSLSAKIHRLLVPTAATACGVAPTLAGIAAGDPEWVTAGAAVGLAGLQVAGGALQSAIGSSLADRFRAGAVGKTGILRHRDLHQLCGTAVAALIDEQADAARRRGAKDEQRLLTALAANVRKDWDIVTSAPSWHEMIEQLSQGDLVQTMQDAGIDWSGNEALTADHWFDLLSAIDQEHTNSIPDPDLRRVATVLQDRYFAKVNELLLADMSSGGRDYPGLTLILQAETLRLITDMTSRQERLSQDLQTTLTKHHSELSNAFSALPSAVDQLQAAAESVIAGHSETSDSFDALRDDWQLARDQWLLALPGISQSLDDIKADTQAINKKLDTEAAKPPVVASPTTSVSVSVTNEIPQPASTMPDAPLPATSESHERTGSLGGLVSLMGGPVFSDSGTFVGRIRELNQMQRLLLPGRIKPTGKAASTKNVTKSPDAGSQVVVLTGPTGAGKTRLIERFVVKKWNQEYPAAQVVRLMMDSSQPGSDALLKTAQIQLATALQLDGPPSEVEERLSHWLEQPGSLLVIENVDSSDCAKAAAGLVAPLVGRSTNLKVMLTSWIDKVGSSQQWQAIPVAAFDQKVSLQLLKTELGNRTFNRLKDHNLDQLVERLDRLPLALHLAAGHLERGDLPDEYWQRLQDVDLKLFPADDADGSPTLHRQFELAMQVFAQDLNVAAESQSQKVVAGFAELGHAPLTGFGYSLGSAITGVSSADYDNATRTAERLHLLERIDTDSTRVSTGQDNHRRYKLRSLFAFWLRRRDGNGDGLQRMTDWFIARLPRPMKNDPRDRPWVEIQNEAAALLDWLERLPDDHVMSVLRVADDFASSCGPFPAWIALCDRADRLAVSDEDRSVLLRVLSWVCHSGGDVDRAFALANEKLNLETSRGDQCEIGEAAVTIGDVHAAQGRPDEALRIWRETALPASSAAGRERDVANIHGRIADVLQARGELDEALRIRREEQLPVYERLGDVRGKAVTQGKIADVLQARGELDEALRIRREEELPVYERLGDVRSKAVTSRKIADILASRGELDEALRMYREEALDPIRGLGMVGDEAVFQGLIADVLQARGELDEALRIRREEQLPVYERLGATRDLLVSRANMAIILLERDTNGDRDEAAELLRQAHSAAERMGIPEAGQIRSIQESKGLES